MSSYFFEFSRQEQFAYLYLQVLVHLTNGTIVLNIVDLLVFSYVFLYVINSLCVNGFPYHDIISDSNYNSE